MSSKIMKNKTQAERRRFLQLTSMALASPLILPDVRYAAHELLVGKAYAQDMAGKPPTNFIEINLRDQWDFGHAFVPPGIATHSGNITVGAGFNDIPLYHNRNDLINAGNGYYLTSDSAELMPHLDSIATCETYELTDGIIHGHEAANALRSPGRSKSGGPGRSSMWDFDDRGEQGNERHYSSTPTPLALHNHWVHQVDPSIRNAAAFKLMSRYHTCFHHSAGLSQAQPDRYQTKQAIYDAYRNLDLNANNQIMPTKREAEELIATLNKLDERFVQKYGYKATGQQSHLDVLAGAKGLVHQEANGVNLGQIQLTEEERDYWGAGVPNQQAGNSRAEIWEQAAFATKLIVGGVQKSVALEFDYVDVHDNRSKFQMDVMAQQFAIPLARMITQLKENNLYDNTVIAVYSLDGGRSPHAHTEGDEGLNSMILAGGMIKGGYFGDVTIGQINGSGKNENAYYHRPESNGVATSNPVANRDRGGRIPGRDGWRTLMRALNIPDSLAGGFSDTANGQVQQYMLNV